MDTIKLHSAELASFSGQMKIQYVPNSKNEKTPFGLFSCQVGQNFLKPYVKRSEIPLEENWAVFGLDIEGGDNLVLCS